MWKNPLAVVVVLAVGVWCTLADERAAGSSPATGSDDALISVGVARIDVTPDEPIRLNGYAVRKTESAGVAQRLWAKALAIGTDDQGPAVLVTVDNCIVREPGAGLGSCDN